MEAGPPFPLTSDGVQHPFCPVLFTRNKALRPTQRKGRRFPHPLLMGGVSENRGTSLSRLTSQDRSFVRMETRPQTVFNYCPHPSLSPSCAGVRTSSYRTNLWLFRPFCFPSRGSHRTPNKPSVFGSPGLRRDGPNRPSGPWTDVPWFIPTTWTRLTSGERQEPGRQAASHPFNRQAHL